MKRILVVDDDRGVLGLISRVLSGYSLTVAGDGFEALSAVGRLDQLDLLITDYLMPSMVGDELIGHMRARYPHVKVLVITGHGNILDDEAPAWWLAEAHMPKPLRIDAFRERVARLIGN